MLVNSAVFGSLEVASGQIFSMPQGLFGFEKTGDFALITKKEDDVTLMWYQAVDQTVPCFVVFNPFEIIDGYDPVLEPSDLKALGDAENGALEYLVIAVVPDDISKITVNLKSPIVLNRKTQMARQVILSNKDYPISFSLVPQEGE